MATLKGFTFFLEDLPKEDCCSECKDHFMTFDGNFKGTLDVKRNERFIEKMTQAEIIKISNGDNNGR